MSFIILEEFCGGSNIFLEFLDYMEIWIFFEVWGFERSFGSMLWCWVVNGVYWFLFVVDGDYSFLYFGCLVCVFFWNFLEEVWEIIFECLFMWVGCLSMIWRFIFFIWVRFK